MTIYEQLLALASEENLTVLEKYDLSGTRLEGLCFKNTIALNKNRTEIEKSGTLAEEISHHELTVGNILDTHDPGCRHQEYIARCSAYDKLVGMPGLIRIWENHCQNIAEAAELLEVSPKFLYDAIVFYSGKFGNVIRYGNYVITFVPWSVESI